jgi:hypothetical protein
MVRVLCIAALLSGCLDDARPQVTKDAGTPDANPAATSVPRGTPFPPAGANLQIEDVWAGDLNGDGSDDLVVLSRGTANEVYIFYGQRERGATEFHQVLDTGAREPFGVTAAQMTGEEELEILVYLVDFATPADSDNTAFVYGYETVSRLRYATTPVTNSVSRVMKVWAQPTTPVYGNGIVTGRFTPGASLPGIAVGVHTGGFQLQPESWELFGDAVPTPLRDGQPAVRLRAIPSQTSGLDDVLGFSVSSDSLWFVNDGAGSLTSYVRLTGALERARVVDGDSSGPLDLLGIQNTTLQIVLTGDPGQAYYWQGQGWIDGIEGSFTDLAVVDSDGDARPEVVAIGADCTTPYRPCAMLFPDVFVSGNMLTSSELTSTFDLPASFQAWRIASGDFDGDGSTELLALDRDGTMVCMRIDGVTLVACE